jgi:hypothetical protein
MARCLVLAALCALAAGCFGPGASAPAARPDEAIDVYEAVFRYRLQQQPADAEAYLSVDGQDPPAELLRRLRQDWPNLKPASEEPRDKGRRVYAEGLRWEGRDAAVMKAGYWFPTKAAGQGYFADHHVTRDQGRWVVAKVTNETSS